VEDGAASREGAVAAGRRRNQRAKRSGRSLFLEEKTMERKKKRREVAVLMVFLHCWCSADDRLGRLVVFGREGAGKRCRFEGRRRCWNRLERENQKRGGAAPLEKKMGLGLGFFVFFS
jgi:hypothetical protein